MPAKTRMVTNPGTAHGKIKMVRISGLKRRSFGSPESPAARPPYTAGWSPAASTPRSTAAHPESGAPDGEGENINKVFQPHPVHQLRRRGVVQVVVGEGDGETEQNRKDHHKHQQNKAGVIIRYGKPSLSSIWYCLRTLLRAIPSSRFFFAVEPRIPQREKIDQHAESDDQHADNPSANRKIELSRGTSSPGVYNPTTPHAGNHKNPQKAAQQHRKTSPFSHWR